MKRNVIKINEAQFRKMIKESVRKVILKEYDSDFDGPMDYYGKKRKRDANPKKLFMSWLENQEPGSRNLKGIDWPSCVYSTKGEHEVNYDKKRGDEENIGGVDFVWKWGWNGAEGWVVMRRLSEDERNDKMWFIPEWEIIYSPEEYGDEENMSPELTDKLKSLYEGSGAEDSEGISGLDEARLNRIIRESIRKVVKKNRR